MSKETTRSAPVMGGAPPPNTRAHTPGERLALRCAGRELETRSGTRSPGAAGEDEIQLRPNLGWPSFGPTQTNSCAVSTNFDMSCASPHWAAFGPIWTVSDQDNRGSLEIGNEPINPRLAISSAACSMFAPSGTWSPWGPTSAARGNERTRCFASLSSSRPGVARSWTKYGAPGACSCEASVEGPKAVPPPGTGEKNGVNGSES